MRSVWLLPHYAFRVITGLFGRFIGWMYWCVIWEQCHVMICVEQLLLSLVLSVAMVTQLVVIGHKCSWGSQAEYEPRLVP